MTTHGLFMTSMDDSVLQNMAVWDNDTVAKHPSNRLLLEVQCNAHHGRLDHGDKLVGSLPERALNGEKVQVRSR